jgi:hypothetical protein
MLNSIPSSLDKSPVEAQKPNETTSAQLAQNLMLAVVLFVFKCLTTRNTIYAMFWLMIIKSFFIQVNYTFYAVVFLVGIYFEICELVDLTKEKKHITINNKIEQNLINETGFPLTIKKEN